MFDRIRSKLRRLRPGSRENALCILPWIHLHARVDGTALPCCVADERHPAGSLHDSSVEEVFNSQQMRTLRRDMLAGVRSSACRRCYALEDAGGHSLRKIFNLEYKRHAGVVAETGRDGSANVNRIVYLDIRFSNLCNLRCRTCGPAASTSWYQDDPSAAPSDFRILRAGRSKERLWEQIEPYLPHVETMHFAGGEPLMTDETFLTLEKLLELGRNDVSLTFNTNVTSWTYRKWDALELWKRFDRVKVMASLDGSGPRGEYIRKGLDWRKAVENCLRLRRECPDVGFQINFTLGLMNALHLPEFVDDCEAEGLAQPDEVYLNYVQDPIEMSMTSLPPVLKRRVRTLYQERRRLLGLDSPFSARLAEALRFIDSRDTADRLGDLRRRTRALDAKRSEDFAATFPELAELMAGA